MATPAALELVAVTKRYGTTLAVDADRPEDPGRHLLLPARPFRLRQDHDAAHDRRPRGRERRATSCSATRNITDLPPAKRGTAMMFQSYALFPHLSALDNVAFSLKMRGVDKAERHAKRAASCSSCVAMERLRRRASRRSSRAASSSASRSPAR